MTNSDLFIFPDILQCCGGQTLNIFELREASQRHSISYSIRATINRARATDHITEQLGQQGRIEEKNIETHTAEKMVGKFNSY